MTLPVSDLSKEMSTLLNNSVYVSISRSEVHSYDGATIDTILMCSIMRSNSALTSADKERLVEWLRVRTNTNLIKLICE